MSTHRRDDDSSNAGRKSGHRSSRSATIARRMEREAKYEIQGRKLKS